MVLCIKSMQRLGRHFCRNSELSTAAVNGFFPCRKYRRISKIPAENWSFVFEILQNPISKDNIMESESDIIADNALRIRTAPWIPAFQNFR